MLNQAFNRWWVHVRRPKARRIKPSTTKPPPLPPRMTVPATETLSTIPEIPKDFGEDGGHFYRCYDKLTEEADHDLIKSLTSQLDGILIFAGLFAAVNSAFLALTLPQMSANPADDTNALLLQIALGKNGTINSAADLPSASFTPPSEMRRINVLFSMSLTLAILSSFLAVLGQQWLVNYRSRSGGGPEHQRWELLRRHLGAKRWRLELVLDDVLPSILQIGLIIFSIAFIMYLGTLNTPMCRAILAPFCTGLAIIIAFAICAAWDEWCPFKSPLSRFIQLVLPPLIVGLGKVIASIAHSAITRWDCISRGIRHRSRSRKDEWSRNMCNAIREWFALRARRTAEDHELLKVEALKRVMSSSEDRDALIHAAMNLQSIKKPEILSSLINDDEFFRRIHNLCERALDCGNEQEDGSRMQRLEARAFSSSLSHLVLSAGSLHHFLARRPGESWNPENIKNTGTLALRTQLKRLRESTVIRFHTACDHCSHCTIISFFVTLIHAVIRTPREVIQILHHALENLQETLSASAELRIGYVAACGVVYLKDWHEENNHPLDDTTVPWRFDAAGDLLSHFRVTSKSDMVQTIGNALSTSDSCLRSRPDPELYVRLLENAISVKRGQDDTLDHYEAILILRNLGKVLNGIEFEIRSEAESEDGRRMGSLEGRRLRERCVQSAKDFVKGLGLDGRTLLWAGICDPLQQSFDLTTAMVTHDPQNPENSFTKDAWKALFLSLPDPDAVHLRGPLSVREIARYKESYSAFANLFAEVNAVIPDDDVSELELGISTGNHLRSARPTKRLGAIGNLKVVPLL